MARGRLWQKRAMHASVVHRVAKRGRTFGSAFSFSCSAAAHGLPLGRTTCGECGWKKAGDAPSLLETQLCRESMRGERQSPISIVSRNRTLNQMKQSLRAACCGRCGKGCAARGRHGKKRGAPAAGRAAEETAGRSAAETQDSGGRSQRSGLQLPRAAQRVVLRFQVPAFAGNAE
jgi:hypothetical protein